MPDSVINRLQSMAEVRQMMVLLLAGAMIIPLLVFLRSFRGKARARIKRERDLETTIGLRALELESERHRERARGRILEQLLANDSLGTVLDGIAKYVNDQAPGCLSAILLNKRGRWDVAAAPGVPREWLEALRQPHTLPFEIWNRDYSWSNPETPRLWKALLSSVSGSPPVAVHSCFIGSAESRFGAMVAFETGSGNPTEAQVQAALQIAVPLASVATQHRQMFDDLTYRAHHDALTGLPNRVLFEERLSTAVREAELTQKSMAVLSIDLDRFRRINDTLSPRAGDVALTELASRIRSVARDSDTVARTGGDEFVVIASNIARSEDVMDLCARILEALRQPMLVDGKALSITASIGSAMFPADGSDPEWLRRKADAALVCARNQGRNRAQAFADSLEALDRVRLEEDLRHALEQDLLAVHYQPKVGAGGAFCGVEALVRLSTPERGAISPAAFIPVAEESGLISQLGMWVLSEVCRQMREWHGAGLGWIPVAVNVSPLQISQAGFGSEVRKCLHSYGVPPESVELEITESVVLGGGKEGERQMRELQRLGIQFSIDDFGTGYSSLSYLYLLPVHAIKLDRSFVQAIGTDEGARRLVQAMIGVAEGLGLEVVAEGVETEEQRSLLIAAGCPIMQGYLFARPAPAADIEKYISLSARGTRSVHRETTRRRSMPLPAGDTPSDDLLHLSTAVSPDVTLHAL